MLDNMCFQSAVLHMLLPLFYLGKNYEIVQYHQGKNQFLIFLFLYQANQEQQNKQD